MVRQGDDGVGVEFIFRNPEEEAALWAFLAAIPAQSASPSSGGPARRAGQALVEFAVIVPLVFLLAVNAANFGGFLFAWITVANAARAGAQYMVMSSASPGSPTPVTSAQITSAGDK